MPEENFSHVFRLLNEGENWIFILNLLLNELWHFQDKHINFEIDAFVWDKYKKNINFLKLNIDIIVINNQ